MVWVTGCKQKALKDRKASEAEWKSRCESLEATLAQSITHRSASRSGTKSEKTEFYDDRGYNNDLLYSTMNASAQQEDERDLTALVKHHQNQVTPANEWLFSGCLTKTRESCRTKYHERCWVAYLVERLDSQELLSLAPTWVGLPRPTKFSKAMLTLRVVFD